MLKTIVTFITLALVLAGTAWGQQNSSQAADGVNQTVNGKKHGHWVEPRMKGKTDEGDYTDGKRTGIWITRSADGVTLSEVTYTDGVAKGPAKTYYADGTLMESGTWNVDHWEGEYVRYNESGGKACNFTYNDKGHREGRQVYYYDNGRVMYDGMWADGRITGSVAVYDRSGRKTGERKYDENGRYCGGPAAVLPDTGQQVTAKPRRMDSTGDLTTFDKNGRKAQKGRFEDGKLINGEEYHYDQTGRLIRIDKVKNGKVVSHVTR